MFWKGSKAAINTDPEELAKRGLDPQAVADATKSKEERWFLMKLDIFLLTFGCCSQVIKYIGAWDHDEFPVGRVLTRPRSDQHQQRVCQRHVRGAGAERQPIELLHDLLQRWV
jgi:hypothetical protein